MADLDPAGLPCAVCGGADFSIDTDECQRCGTVDPRCDACRALGTPYCNNCAADHMARPKASA